jgi:hypothetical protein
MNEKINFESPIPYYIQLVNILKEKFNQRSGNRVIKSPASRIFVSCMG